MRAWAFCAVSVWVLGLPCGVLADDCNHPTAPITYQAQPEDRGDAKSLDASRSFAGVHVLKINVCQGELRFKGTQSSSVRLEMTAENADQPLSRYLQKFAVGNGSADIDVRIPSKYHPVITIYVPAENDLQSEVNLGAGSLSFPADRVEGRRKLNLGAGKVVVFLDGGRDYAGLEANVGMGSFHDRRPGGGSAHFAIARTMKGSGTGDLQINVGAGSIELEPAK